MPDPILILKASTAAAVTAAAVFLLFAWPWRMPHPVRAPVGSLLGVALGFCVGGWFLELHLHWPPREDQDRLLLLLFPALIAIELLATLPGWSGWLAWPLRLILAGSAARILLHNSSYLVELAGSGMREWTPAQTALILGALAAALVGVWAALLVLARQTQPDPGLAPTRGQGISMPLAVALACGGATVTDMLSGYASAGQIGFPLAASLVGALAAALALPRPPDVRGLLSLGVVGLFALLVIGHFFGELATDHAALLFFGTLLAWVPEVPYFHRLGARWRGLARVVLVTVPVAIVVMLAQQEFLADSSRTSPGLQEPSLQDYLDYGK
jgi:hypothetical protein